MKPVSYLRKKLFGSPKTARAAAQRGYPPAQRHGMRLASSPIRFGVSLTSGSDYQNKFYVMHNIIGYAGDLRHGPTVFFFDGAKYGHIVQSDPDPINIGREVVDDVSEVSGTQYEITNERVDGAMVAVERFIHPNGVPSAPFYIYGSRFIDCRPMNGAQRENIIPILAQAIWKFRSKKEKWVIMEAGGYRRLPR